VKHFHLSSALFLAFILFTLLNLPTYGEDSQPPSDVGALHVFLDCQGGSWRHCDFDHVRREIEWVDWVRDRKDAQVHLLVTAQQTGGGGSSYTLDFIGLEGLEAETESISYVSDPNGTQAEIRERLTRTFAIGLVRYVASTPLAQQLQLSYDDTSGPSAQTELSEDPWRLWIFRVSANGSFNDEALQRGSSYSGSVSANRTSDRHKFDWGASAWSSHDEFEINGDTLKSTLRSFNTSLLSVWSLSDHWSAGLVAGANHSSFSNIDLAVIGGPVLEYSLFPYRESTRKSFTFQYSVESVSNQYETLTVAGETEEVLERQRLVVAVDFQQPWGNMFGEVAGTQYFHDPSTHRMDIYLGANVRIFRGFNFNIWSSFARIKDQFFLSAAGLTPAEILLQRGQRETDYRYRLNMGFSYRFGSKLANVVNPRMGRGFRSFY
jgi:hypothetical protein